MSEHVLMKASCGFCMTQHHQNCKPVLEWNNKLYLCGCKTCDVHSQYKDSQKEQEDTTDEEHDEG